MFRFYDNASDLNPADIDQVMKKVHEGQPTSEKEGQPVSVEQSVKQNLKVTPAEVNSFTNNIKRIFGRS